MERKAVILLIALIIFVILTIVFLFLYFSALVYRINPLDCPASNSEFSVVQNLGGDILQECIAIGEDVTDPACKFRATTMSEAISLCRTYNCTAFQFNQVNQVTFISTPLVPKPEGTITYLRNSYSQ